MHRCKPSFWFTDLKKKKKEENIFKRRWGGGGGGGGGGGEEGERSTGRLYKSKQIFNTANNIF